MEEARSKKSLAAAFQGAVRPKFGEVTIRSRGRLPHWEKDTGLYFATYHLADSLPQSVLRKMRESRRILRAAERSGRKLLPHEKAALAELSEKKIEEHLDRGIGACYMRDQRVAEPVANALRFWDGKRYRLFAWCVMPNHVHVVFRTFPGETLAELLGSWKGYSSRMGNRILGRRGTFWEHEYYDHLIRDGAELDRAIAYVCSNPEKAGLHNWRWVWRGATPADCLTYRRCPHRLSRGRPRPRFSSTPAESLRAALGESVDALTTADLEVGGTSY